LASRAALNRTLLDKPYRDPTFSGTRYPASDLSHPADLDINLLARSEVLVGHHFASIVPEAGDRCRSTLARNSMNHRSQGDAVLGLFAGRQLEHVFRSVASITRWKASKGYYRQR
jgi:hypothetical protein